MKHALFLFGLMLGFAAGSMWSVSLQSQAEPQLEMLLGQAKFHPRENGTWWQSGPSSETKNGLISSSYLIGVRDTFTPWRSLLPGYRFGYTRLGDFSGNNWASVHDADADHVLTEQTCDPETARDCPALYKGSGRAQGIYFGPTVERVHGKLHALAEVGIFAFRSSYDVSVYHPYDNYFVPKGNTFEYRHATGDHTTWYWGGELSYALFRDASVVLLYRQYWNVYEQGKGAHGDVGLTGGGEDNFSRTRQVLAGLRVSF